MKNSEFSGTSGAWFATDGPATRFGFAAHVHVTIPRATSLSLLLSTQTSPEITMMFARVLAFACLVLGTEAFFMGTPLRTPGLSTSCRTATSMKVPTDHPEIEVSLHFPHK